MTQNQTFKTVSYRTGQWQECEIPIISEKPVSLSVNGETWLTFMCTPTHLEALAAGFLFNEGIVDQQGDIASIKVCPESDAIDVWLNRTVKKPESWTRTSGCSGGETTVREPVFPRGMLTADDGMLITAQQISDLLRLLGESQHLYKISGGVHTSAISDGVKIIVVAEDIGRHNTLDKLAGRLLLEDIHLSRKIILTTGRVSSEMIQKSGRIGAQIVISRTSPTSLSVEMAKELGMTLVGYARQDRFTVYAHAERLIYAKEGKVDKGEAP